MKISTVAQSLLAEPYPASRPVLGLALVREASINIQSLTDVPDVTPSKTNGGGETWLKLTDGNAKKKAHLGWDKWYGAGAEHSLRGRSLLSTSELEYPYFPSRDSDSQLLTTIAQGTGGLLGRWANCRTPSLVGERSSMVLGSFREVHGMATFEMADPSVSCNQRASLRYPETDQVAMRRRGPGRAFNNCDPRDGEPLRRAGFPSNTMRHNEALEDSALQIGRSAWFGIGAIHELLSR
jgi:hypothetical protein